MTLGSHRSPPRPAPHPVLTAALALLPAVIVVIALHRHVFRGLVPARLSTLYDHDQLGYLAIVTNVAHGHGAGPEPDTISGLNPYPSGYYTLVGTVARVLHVAPVTAWNGTSMALQVMAFTVLGVTVAALTRRSWTAALGALVPLTGAAARLVTGIWLIPINHQGALWGPFGVLFPMNGETAGLCAVVTGICLLALAWARPGAAPTARSLLTLGGAALLGVAANFQTYNFLTGTYVVGAVIAVAGLVHHRARRDTLLTALLLVAMVVLGPVVAHVAGSLAALVFGLVPMVPGALLLVRRAGWRVVVFPLVFALAAAPMILSTLAVRNTPFMRYRVTSNVALGVEKWQTLAASAPLLAVMAALAVIGWRRRDAITVGIGIGFPISWALVSLNDLWGANAEPYRFWIDAYLMGLVLALLAFARCWGAAPGHGRRAGRGLVVVTLAAALMWAVSLGDVRAFLSDPKAAATWDPGSAHSRDIVAAVGDLQPGQGRLWMTSCNDVREVKVLTGAPVAYYHLGMAWPDDRSAVDAATAAANEHRIDVPVLRAASVRWVLTEEGCDPVPPAGLTPVRTAGDLTLWRVDGQ